jgi:hypothetical protein
MQTLFPLQTWQSWDIAGVDGLAQVRDWFGETVERLSPFQSLETHWQGQPCSLLRLCESNFRLSIPANLVFATLPSQQRVWIQQFNWLGAMALPETVLSPLAQIAIPKPPHRLMGLEPNCALPARLHGTAILIWRHPIAGVPMLEIQTAQADLARVIAQLVAGM